MSKSVLKSRLLFFAFILCSLHMSFASPKKFEPSTGKVKDITIMPPRISPEFVHGDLKKDISEYLQGNVFFDAFLVETNPPRLYAHVNPLLSFNACFAKLKITPLSVMNKKGKNVLIPPQEQLNIPLWGVTNNIFFINLHKGTKREELVDLELEINISYPKNVTFVEFKAGDKPGTIKKIKDKIFTLKQLEKDTALVECNSGSHLFLYALSDIGWPLKLSESQGDSKSKAARFNGEIRKLIPTSVTGYSKATFKIKLDVNKIFPEEMPMEPTKNITLKPKFQFNMFENVDFNTKKNKLRLDVFSTVIGDDIYAMQGKNKFMKKMKWDLKIVNNDGTHVKKSKYESHFSETVNLQYKRGVLKNVGLITGTLEFDDYSDVLISNHRLYNQFGSNKMSGRFKNGERYTILHKDNQITIESKTPILKVFPMNKDHILLQTGYWGQTTGKSVQVFCWGIPHSVMIQIPGKTIRRKIQVEEKSKNFPTEIYNLVKQETIVDKKIQKILQEIYKNKFVHYFKSSPMGIASAHFLDNKNNNKKSQLRKELAESDPTGAEVFGYKCKSYEDYNFMFAHGTIGFGDLKKYKLTDREQTYKFNGKEMKFKVFPNHRIIMAVPANPKLPLYIITNNKVYRTRGYKGEKEIYVPWAPHQEKDWELVKE